MSWAVHTFLFPPSLTPISFPSSLQHYIVPSSPLSSIITTTTILLSSSTLHSVTIIIILLLTLLSLIPCSFYFPLHCIHFSWLMYLVPHWTFYHTSSTGIYFTFILLFYILWMLLAVSFTHNCWMIYSICSPFLLYSCLHLPNIYFPPYLVSITLDFPFLSLPQLPSL